MRDTEILVVGGGPAGLCAAKAASSLGAKVLICERDELPGGQLVKQTHKFFGSRKQYAGDRGTAIGAFLLGEVQNDPKIEVMPDTTVIGIYEDGLALAERNEKIIKVNSKKIIVATGAAEKFLPFPGNDLPGIYGAGAVQTLMNVEGVIPGEMVLMVGAGNIGLIVSYQLAQAGVKTAAVIEAAPTIGGYLVHASKIQRIGIPVRTGYTIKEAYGEDRVKGAVICRVDENWNVVAGTEEDIKCDTICLAVGLAPLTALCWQAGCELAYVRELSGHVPLLNKYMQTTNQKIFAAGDVSGIEEASSAMVEGRLAGYSAALDLGYGKDTAPQLQAEAIGELSELRAGPAGERIRIGIEKVEKLFAKSMAARGSAC
jgi:sarcosine oxidase subunit alpha